MRTVKTIGIQFVLRMERMKNGQAPIYARITVDSRRVEIALKKYIDPKDWSDVKGMANGTRQEIKVLNHFLDEVKSSMMNCYHELLLKKEMITAEVIKSMFLGEDKSEYTLAKLVAYHNTQLKDTLTWGTMKNYFTTQKYVLLFLEKQMKAGDIYLSQLTYKVIMDFEYFLRRRKQEDCHRPLNNNGVMKHMERLRKMVSLTIRMDWISKDPFAMYKPKFDKVERGYLTTEELSRIEGKKFSLERLDWVRDLFVFSCYTGLAYIDMRMLTPAKIVVGIDGGYWIETKRKKSSIPVRVPLLPKALEIINKYIENPRSQINGTVFPIISNQKLNSYLKEIAVLCSINKCVTFHLARHTFATTVTLTNGVPIESVSKMLGHTKLTTTQIYAKVIDRKLSDDMISLRSKLTLKR